MKQRIRDRLLKCISAMLAFSLLGVLLTLLTVNGQKTSGVVINLAGAQRMLSQKMTKEALLLTRGKGDPKELLKSAARFDKVYQGLIQGDAELNLPPCADQEVCGLLKKAGPLWLELKGAVQTIADGRDHDGAALQLLASRNTELLAAMHAVVVRLETLSTSSSARLIWEQLAGLLVMLAVAGVVVKVVRDITFRLARLVEYAERLKVGNFRGTLTDTQDDELGALVGVLNTVTERIRELLAGLKASSDALATAAEQLNGTSSELVKGAQGSAVQTTRIAQASQDLAGQVSTVSQAVVAINGRTEDVAAAVEQLSASFKEVARSASTSHSATSAARQRVGHSLQVMELLQESTQRVREVNRAIQSIASQTRLLALNASIEAAAAGQAGKGFSIVAQEVKTLAAQSHVSVEQVGTHLSTMLEQVARMRDVLKGIEEDVSQVDALSSNLAAAAEEQTSVTHHISEQVQGVSLEVRGLTASVAASAQNAQVVSSELQGIRRAVAGTTEGALKTRHAAEDMERMAVQLRGMTAQYVL